MQLLRNGYDVKCAQLYQEDFGFLVSGRGKKFYVTVSDSKDTEELNAVAENLLRIKDNYPKTVLARTSATTADSKGIAIADVSNWLYNN